MTYAVFGVVLKRKRTQNKTYCFAIFN